MNKREQTIYNILKAALKMFREQGFQATSVRQIAEEAQVSLGMVNHYFICKEYLGAQVLLLLSDYASTGVPQYISFEQDPILFDLVGTRMLSTYLIEHGYKEFYLDSLRKDFFFNYLSARPMKLLQRLQKQYPNITATEDEQRLYTKYMPYMMEKTLMLKKEEGMFSTIGYDDIPYLICQTSMGRFVPEEDIRSRDAEGRRITAKVGAELQDFPPEEMMQDFVRKLDAALKDASSNSRDFMLKQVSNSLM